MNVRKGGSYVADEKSGHERRVAHTTQEAASRLEQSEAPMEPELPPPGGDPPPPPPPHAGGQHRRPRTAAQE